VGRVHRSCDTQTCAMVPHLDRVIFSRSGSKVPWPGRPGCAAKGTVGAIPGLPRATVTRRPIITLVPAILCPCPDVASDIVETERVRPEAPDRGRVGEPVITGSHR